MMDDHYSITMQEDFSHRESRYNNLKEYFLQHTHNLSSDAIEQLKELYSDIIDSKREKDRIKNIIELLRILEKRDALRCNKIEPLKYISKVHINNDNLNQAIIQYENEVNEENPLPLMNFYKYTGEYICMMNDNELLLFNDKNCNTSRLGIEEKQIFHQQSNFCKYLRKRDNCQCIIVITLLSIILVIPPTFIVIYVYNNTSIKSSAPDRDIPHVDTSTHTHTVNFNPIYATSNAVYQFNFISSTSSDKPPTDLQKTVFKVISENIGRYWRDLVRFLDVKESEIDLIEERNDLTIREKAYEALLIFQSRCDPYGNWKMKIQKALEKARRKDLAEKISEIYLSVNN